MRSTPARAVPGRLRPTPAHASLPLLMSGAGGDGLVPVAAVDTASVELMRLATALGARRSPSIAALIFDAFPVFRVLRVRVVVNLAELPMSI